VNLRAFPTACHVCEVEVDPETGAVEVVNYAAVTSRSAVNPLIIHGQIHGGIAQGIGQAVLERCFLRSRQRTAALGLVHGYAMPRASDLPCYATAPQRVPSTNHPLGIRPAGEAVSCRALAVSFNAIVHALWRFGVGISRCLQRRSGFGAPFMGRLIDGLP